MEFNKEFVVKFSKGNIGAATALLNMHADLTKEDFDIIQTKLISCPSIKGTNIYVLYSDLCDKRHFKVLSLCKNCPNDILEDACNRQDYSGLNLVKKYL